jgi:hypothetical protein
MDDLFDASASRVLFVFAIDDLMVFVPLRKRQGLELAGVDGRAYWQQVTRALSCGGRFDVCADCAMEWSPKVFSSVRDDKQGPVGVVVRLRRSDTEGCGKFHIPGGSCTGVCLGEPLLVIGFRGEHGSGCS